MSYRTQLFRCLALAPLALLSWAQPSQAQSRDHDIAVVVPQTGPLANVGKEVVSMTKAVFDDFNQRNTGIKLTLTALDDGNVAAQSTAQSRQAANSALALLSCFGSVSCLAQQKVAAETQVPLIGPIAGAAPLRGDNAQAGLTFALRASAQDEVKRLMDFAGVMGMNRIAVLVQDDGFGQAYDAELKKVLPMVPGATVERRAFNPQGPNYDALATELGKTAPQALLLLANASHSSSFLQAWAKQRPLPFVLNLAGQANALFANRMKERKEAAVAFVTVTPSPWESKTELQRDYQRILQAAKLPPSYLSFEAYINARVLIDALTKGGATNRATLGRYLARTANVDLGGFIAHPGTGSHWTDLSLLRPDGSYRH